MKTAVLVLLLLAAANCNLVEKFFPMIHQVFSNLIDSIEAHKPSESFLQNAQTLAQAVQAYKDALPPLEINTLEPLGYRVSDCDNDLKKLQNLFKQNSVVCAKSRLSSNHSKQEQNFRSNPEDINTCSQAEQSLDSVFNENKDLPKCKEAVKKVRKSLAQKHRSSYGYTKYFLKDNDAKLAVLIACGH
eukprot:TRINITY_DN2970_c0_g3_i1.p1 TRINITY_DN2970_c0_g3~~TRINITY_DN2970_c0_g3_i1.p1  ORF type:complete len:188 (+),score=20.72 TRINITY_DN2970_c0_g3_i1:57-620(+)